MAGEGIEQGDVPLCGVGELPDVPARSDVREQTGGSDLVGVVGDLVGGGRRPVALSRPADLLVNGSDLFEERVEVDGEGVQGAPERKVTARREQGVSVPVADLGVDPVPCRGCEDELEALRWAGEPLEMRAADVRRARSEVAPRAAAAPDRDRRAGRRSDLARPPVPVPPSPLTSPHLNPPRSRDRRGAVRCRSQ